ncbi:EF-P beta-lysylation protein EpmB [Thiohalobacter sp. IOR34]|uniref:EF-P beta-lysylation protein EpmB n=1 Tax=Thiohalobacter sp. IOR34 TaxID=3057176 RepID=UPI0025B15AA0|nr:EF-P beta-lysylation protein EpmB [Thiohalobacter sp. IOR34]WJW76245.1 EF-P beta-lysylation protein EpmB [Thiohalobacter sp. IOR34]
MNKPARIIPRSAGPGHAPAWQRALAEAISDPAELLRQLGLPPEPGAAIGHGLFPLRVPRGFVARMRPGDRRDPLLLQVLPVAEEAAATPGYCTDPLQELEAMPLPGLLHKYHGRVLLTATGACAVHCRYCFRRHFPYAQANPAAGQWRPILDYLRADASIHELILSGGDPLSLSDRRLAELAEALATLPQMRRLRIHSRLPVVLPERVDAALLDWLARIPLQTVLVVHCNHANELDATVGAALAALRDAGVTLLNQAVLLRGVNDNLEAQTALAEALFAAGVLPYYLHQLDPVQGAAHFAVADNAARQLHEALRARLPGYLLPRLVREHPGHPAKSPLA